jgi:hypothetical protein
VGSGKSFRFRNQKSSSELLDFRSEPINNADAARGVASAESATRFATALSQSILLAPASASGAGEIFFTDLSGDGVTGDPLPGTNRGSFGRDVDVAEHNQLNRSNRYGLGSGSFAPGIPRAFQFGIRVGF